MLRIIIVDELDALNERSKETISTILHIPICSPKTLFIGIANSVSFFSDMLHYYGKYPSHKAEQLIFEAYTGLQIEQILAAKLNKYFGSKEIVEGLISEKALHCIGAKVANMSGDIRSAFEICKAALEEQIMKNVKEPIQMMEIVSIINAKYKSKLVGILQKLPRDQLMIAATIYNMMDTDHKDFYTYDEVKA